ncbi:MAG: porin [Burkholderiales bacterium]|nr:porin [Burkholderiales bacterium]
MKKSLIALAVLGASSFAMAQSSVTIYGVANVGIGGGTGVKTQMMDQPDGTGSRLGFKGTEDLGGGLKANFLMENGFFINNGALDNTTNKLFQRQAWMGLSGGFGELRMGRQYTVGFDTSIWTIPSTRASAVLGSGLGFNGMGARNDNMFKYLSPNFSGFSVEASYQLKNNTDPAPNTAELALKYANGPLTANLYANKVKSLSTGWALNGAYNFGGFAVNAGYIDAPGNGTARGFHLGAGGTFGAINPWINVARNTQAKRTGVDLGANYALSKRTRLYAVYSRVNNASTNVWGVGVAHNF